MLEAKVDQFGAEEVRRRLTESRPGKLGRALRSVGSFIGRHPAEASLIPTVIASGVAYDYLSGNHVLLRGLGILPRIIISDTLTPGSQIDITAHQAEFTTDPIEIAAPTANETPTSAAAIIATPEATATTAPTTAPTEVPATPTPKLGYESTDQGLIYRSEKSEILNVPQIEGLKAVLVTENEKQKVVYQAQENNKYGLEAESYAGEYIYNVAMKGEDGKEKQTGGVVLTSPVVRQLINEKLATIPDQRDKWIIVLPVDPSGSDASNNIIISSERFVATNKVGLNIRFKGELPLINVMPDSSQLRIVMGGYYGGAFMDNIRLIDPYTDRVFPGKEMQYITVGTKLRDFSINTTIKTSFGVKVSMGGAPVIVGHGAVEEYDDITSDKILYAGKSPIFLAANDSNNKAQHGFKTLADGSIDFGKGVIGPSKADQN